MKRMIIILTFLWTAVQNESTRIVSKGPKCTESAQTFCRFIVPSPANKLARESCVGFYKSRCRRTAKKRRTSSYCKIMAEKECKAVIENPVAITLTTTICIKLWIEHCEQSRMKPLSIVDGLNTSDKNVPLRSTQRKTKPPRRSVCKKMAEEQCDKTVRFPKENIVGMKACIKQETDNCRRTRQIPAKTKRVVKKDKNKPKKKPKPGDVSRKRACDNSNKHPCAVTSPTNGASRRVTKLPRRIAIAHQANPELSL